jgi:hypothetical protein
MSNGTMPPLNLNQAAAEVNGRTSEDQLWATRGKAVQAYAKLEQVLCQLFADVSGTTLQIAAIVFFRIASASTRNDILEKLIKLRHGDKFNLFWNSVFKAMRPLDNERNAVVHWCVVSQMEFSHGAKSDLIIALRPPTYWSTFDDSAPQITNSDLLQFTRKCGFYEAVIGTFCSVTSASQPPAVSAETIAAWLGIFQQPLIYPPLAGTALAPILEGLDRPASTISGVISISSCSSGSIVATETHFRTPIDAPSCAHGVKRDLLQPNGRPMVRISFPPPASPLLLS